MCKIDGCNNKVSTLGLCWVHYEKQRYAKAPPCKISGCDIHVHSKGLCNKHYRQELNARTDRRHCLVAECTDPIHANGLCTKHHIRLRRHGSLNPVRPKYFTGSDKQYEEYYRIAASRSLKRKYGITLQDYEIIHEKQNGECAICNSPETTIEKSTGNIRRLAVDHCHVTGKVRGLLCAACNTSLGKFKDSPDILSKAIAYLNHHSQ